MTDPWQQAEPPIDPPEPVETCDCEHWQFCDVCGTREDFLLHESDRG